MSFHKKSTNERALVHRHLNHVRRADDLDSLINAISSEEARAHHSTAQDTTTAKKASHLTLSPVTVISSVAVRPSNTPIVSATAVSSKAIPTVPIAVGVSTSSSITPTAPLTFSSPQPTTSSSTLASPLPSADSAQAQGQNNSKEGISTGAVGAIVGISLLLLGGVVAFFVRKILKRRRAIKRNTWGAGLVPALESKRDTVYGNVQPSQMSQNTAGNRNSTFKTLSPPPPSYLSNPSPPVTFTPPPIQQPIDMNKAVPPIPPQLTPGQTMELAVVARTFIPTLPDELHISTGERIHVLNAYDDGWALCANMRGEKGVVPVECLQRSGASAEMQLQPQSEFGYGFEKAIKRLSSLTPNAAGTY